MISVRLRVHTKIQKKKVLPSFHADTALHGLQENFQRERSRELEVWHCRCTMNESSMTQSGTLDAAEGTEAKAIPYSTENPAQ